MFIEHIVYVNDIVMAGVRFSGSIHIYPIKNRQSHTLHPNRVKFLCFLPIQFWKKYNTAFNDSFNQIGATIYLSKPDISRTIKYSEIVLRRHLYLNVLFTIFTHIFVNCCQFI